MFKTTLPHWLSGENAQKLQRTARRYIASLRVWEKTLKEYADPMKAPLVVVNLIAQGLNITRVPGEAEALYRTRVKKWIGAAKAAGTIGGLKRALELWDIPDAEIIERDPAAGAAAAETITIIIKNKAYSMRALKRVLEKFGRACRQYRVRYEDPKKSTIPIHAFGQTLILRYEP